MNQRSNEQLKIESVKVIKKFLQKHPNAKLKGQVCYDISSSVKWEHSKQGNMTLDEINLIGNDLHKQLSKLLISSKFYIKIGHWFYGQGNHTNYIEVIERTNL